MINSTITCTLQQWHKITIDFDGPFAQETAATFRNYRLNVTFTTQTPEPP